ncbi:MoxR family ATPase [bacterium]|nr:MoxR family ATPase [bacterium]
MNKNIQKTNERIRNESAFMEDIRAEMEKVIVGQPIMIERMLIGLLANGHILIEGVPGLAKTLAVKTLAATICTSFQRIQFTPDLLPADILGTLIFDQKKQEFIPKHGPVFANLILADEINRAPAKVQSALLEAMQERQVTIGDTTYPLEEPFLVMATQNPIEQEGTYPLPEAQIDRFMLKIKVDYPVMHEELDIVRRHARGKPVEVQPKATPDQILRARQVLGECYMDEKIEQYIVTLVMATRQPEQFGLAEMKPHIQYGASPRASLFMSQAARAHAFLHRRGYVAPEDVHAIAMDVLQHRLILTYEAEAEEVTAEQLVSKILEKVEIP